MYARFINEFGWLARGEATDRKNAAGIKIAAIGAPTRASHFQERRQNGLINAAKHHKREDKIDAGMRVACAPEIVPQWIVVVSWHTPRQEDEKSQTAIQHRRKNDQKYSSEQSLFF